MGNGLGNTRTRGRGRGAGVRPGSKERAPAAHVRSLTRDRVRRVGCFLAAASALLVVAFCAGCDSSEQGNASYVAPSESMEPTIKVGESVRVDTTVYEKADPQINDIIIFHPPAGAAASGNALCGQPPPKGQACSVPTPTNREDLDFLYRIVALPGDRLRIEDGAPVVNGTKAAEDFTGPCGPGGGCFFPVEFTVPARHYYVLGDNRGVAPDSRYWGPVARTAIEGKVVGQ